MRWSMRNKLFIGISALIAFYMMLSLFLNSQFLSRYYFSSKHRQLNNDYEYINSMYSGKPDDIALELEKLERSEGIHIMIRDKDMQLKYGWFQRNRGAVSDQPKNKSTTVKPPPSNLSRPATNRILSQRNADEDNPIIEKIKKLKKNEITIYNTKDRRLRTEFINLIGVMKNGDYLFLSTPRASIEESVHIANKFFAFTGFVTIIIGMIFVYFAVGKITKPISILNVITAKMSTLDFSEKYRIKSNDEIGQLGQSINSMSEQLEKSISELKLSNAKLKEDIERERKIDDMRKEFISNVSHELKTPIALIRGYSEGLKVNVNDDEENKNYYCDVIIDEAEKMNRLVKQFLDLSMIESGGLQIEKEVFDINQFLSQIIKKNSLIFKEKNIEVALESDERIEVNADIYMIEQVIMNFLNNAINHVDDKKHISIKVKRAGDKAHIGVYNTGKHIPEEEMKSIWTSFYKVDKARTRAYGGTGLGLSIVRAIMEQHQNNYGVNNVEAGVYFWIELNM